MPSVPSVGTIPPLLYVLVGCQSGCPSSDHLPPHLRWAHDPAWPIRKSHLSWAVSGQVTPAEPTDPFQIIVVQVLGENALSFLPGSKTIRILWTLVFPTTYAENLLENELNTERKAEPREEEKDRALTI